MRSCHLPRRSPPIALGPPRGFTLIEALVAVVIVSILAVFAVGSYQQKIRRGYSRAAQGLLLDLAGRQETYYSKTRRYASDFGPLLGSSMSGRTQIVFDEKLDLTLGSASANRRFTIDLTNPSGTGTYQLQLAVPSASVQWSKGECARWTVTNLGQRTSDVAGAGSAFVADNSCWD